MDCCAQASSPAVSRILVVDAKGRVKKEDLDAYITIRREEVARRLEACFRNGTVARRWLGELLEEDLYETKDGEQKYMGDASAEDDTKAALAQMKSAETLIEMVEMTEMLILSFCGFSCAKPLKAVCIVNGLHFQYHVDVERLVNTLLPLPSAAGTPTDAVKAIFDDATVGSSELLLRCIVETSDGGLLANPFSPGMPMGKLLKLPLFAQLIMVLTNAVEAVWYEEAIPNCPMGINVYASLLVDQAPVLQMTEGVSVVEIMEMTKGAKRGPEVDKWVSTIRDTGAMVVLDDFDAKHPGIGSKPDGIKVCVFANAFHSLQAFKNEPLGESCASLLPIAELPRVDKERANPFNIEDFYGSIVLPHQSGSQVLIMEGAENCLKSEVQGPPFNFKQPQATTASAHVYQGAARTLLASQRKEESFQMLHQGGRALYKDEDFDEDACAVIEASEKQMAAARAGEAGTMAWMGLEAVRRAAMVQRPLVCGIIKSL